MRPRNLLSVLGTLAIVASAGAQYNPPGTSVSGSGLANEEELRQSLDEASWRLGVLRLQPWIGIRDASFVTSSQDDESDFTASAGAGVRAYVKTGPKVVLAAHALPEYVWWKDDEDKRRLAGRYGLGLFAFFNRLDLELSLRRNETQSFFSSEVQELTTTRRDIARFSFELQVGERLFLTGSHSLTDSENQEEETPVFSLLDQEAETARVGLFVRTPRGLRIGAGYEETENDFDRGARNLSNTEEAVYFEAAWESGRFGTRASVEARSLEGKEGSDFGDLDETTGYLETSWKVNRGVDFFFYGRRQLGYSVRATASNLVAERIGARFDVAWRGATMNLAAEIGRDDFASLTPATLERSDDLLAFGLSLAFRMRKTLSLTMSLIHTEYDSNLDGFDRDVTAWSAALELSGLADKLGLGKSDRIW